MAGCMRFFSGFSSSTGMLPRKMVYYYRPPKVTLLPRKMLYYSPKPLYLLMFQAIPQMHHYFPQRCKMPPKGVLFAPKTYIMTTQNVVLLSRTLVFTDVSGYSPNVVLFPQMTYYSRKMVYYYRPKNLHYDRAKWCITRLNPCIYWCSGYSPQKTYYSPPNVVLLAQKGVLLLTNRR